MNDIYFDVDNAFSNSSFVSINSKDEIQSMYGLINIETVETIGRYTYKMKSDEDNFQDSALPFVIKDLRNNELHLGWNTKQIEKEKHRKLVKIKPPKENTLPDYIYPKSDHAKVYLIFKSPSTVSLNAKEAIEPVVKNGIFIPQVVELQIFEEGRLNMSINQSSYTKSLDIFFDDIYYVQVDYRNTASYLDVYPSYMGKLMVTSFDPKTLKINDLKMSTTPKHSVIEEIRALTPVIQHLKDSAKQVSSSYSLNNPAWVYTGSQGKEGKAHGVGNAMSKDGTKFIISGYFEHGAFKSGVLQTIYGEQFIGNFKDYQLVGEGYHLLKEGTLFTGQYVTGQLQGKGKMMNAEGISYSGEFVNYLLHGDGKIEVPNGDFYEGSFEKGLPNGPGIFNTNGKIEKCEYFRGVRSDQTFKTYTENKRVEHTRKMAPLESPKKIKYLNIHSKRRTANNLFKQMAHNNGISHFQNKIGIDAQHMLSSLPRNFPGVISKVTDDLLRVNNHWLYDRGFIYEKNQKLALYQSLKTKPAVYQMEYDMAQIFLEELLEKNAELNKENLPTEDTEKDTDADNITTEEDDWGWEDEEPVVQPSVAKDVWIPGYFSHVQDGCQVWAWKGYSVLLKTCLSGHVSLQNMDYDPIKATYRVQFKDGTSSMDWQADLLTNTNTKENCDKCNKGKAGVREVYIKDFELDVK